MTDSIFSSQEDRLRRANPMQVSGSISRIVGLVIECRGLRVPVGSTCHIHSQYSGEEIEAEVVGFKDETALLMPLGETTGLTRGDRVVLGNRAQEVAVSSQLLGRVLDGRGRPIDDKGPIDGLEYVPLHSRAPHPLKRKRIRDVLQTGVRCIDGLLTIGRGQRMGLFAGSGVGKSVLLGMISRNTDAQINVIALVGERGREVREFIEKSLGPEGLKRSVVVVATSDEPALVRSRACYTASAIAEYFREQGNDVLLLVDSITRIAYAQREIGLSVGEPPATKGYPPSVFAMMPRLLERSGCSEKGSITGIYSVLVDADDVNEPVADAVRGILDGHVWLNRDLAAKGHYPAIDPGLSISRVMVDVVETEHQLAARELSALLTAYRQAEDLINIGAYAKGSNPRIDQAIAKIADINGFLQQGMDDTCAFQESVDRLIEICGLSSAPGAANAGPQQEAAAPPTTI